LIHRGGLTLLAIAVMSGGRSSLIGAALFLIVALFFELMSIYVKR
jgi:hypothetical protein